MRDFLLDTQTIKYWYDDKCTQHAAVVSNIELLRKQEKPVEHKPRLLVSIVTLGEIEFGHRVQTGDFAKKQDAYIRFVRHELPVMQEFTEDAVTAYAEIRSRLFNKYAPGEKRKRGKRPEQLIDPITSLALTIQENDLWLCAQAVGHGYVLVTNDKMDAIRKVSKGMEPALLIQNWTRDGEVTLDGPIAGQRRSSRTSS